MMTSGTPATLAGRTFISTEEGYSALPPGTYTPTRANGRKSSPVMEPSFSCWIMLCRFCIA